MKIEDHSRNIKESIEVINESITKGIEERQRNIGFNTSVAATEMLEVFLHKLNLIHPGLALKHDLFSSITSANEKLSFDFPHKKEIIELIHEIESKKNLLCYGKPQPVKTMELVISSFNRLKEILKKEGLSWD
jgi:hypothetical protein